MTDDDLNQYAYLNGEYSSQYLHEYKATRDLKVATADEVLQHVSEKYKNVKISELDGLIDKEYPKYKDYQKQLQKTLNSMKDMTVKEAFDEMSMKDRLSYINAEGYSYGLSKKDEKVARENEARALIGFKAVQKIFDNEMMKSRSMNSISQDFLDKGYDAIVDIMDYYGYADYPVIFLTPDNSLRKTYTTEYW